MLFYEHVHLHGGPAPVRRYLPELIGLVWSGKINPGKVFDLTLPLDQVAEAHATRSSFIRPTSRSKTRRVIMNGTAQKTKRLLEKHGVEVITVEYDEVHKYGGRICCYTMHLIRDKGPMTFA